MKYQIRLTAKSLKGAEEVLRWFADHQATTAGGRWYAQFMAKIDTLETQPLRCPLALEAAELGIELRELHFGRRRGLRTRAVLDRQPGF